MKVDNGQVSAYMETEALWQKLHEARVKNGDIMGWDLWALDPGGEDQGFQYPTVTLHNDPIKMMQGVGFQEAFDVAFPNITEQEQKILDATAEARDLVVRIYAQEIATTRGSSPVEMVLGTLARINMMKVDMGNYRAYEKAEAEDFQPLHQKAVDAGEKTSWGLISFMNPVGSDTYASHMTAKKFKDYKQALNQNINFNEGASPATTKLMQEGIAARDMKFVYMAQLIRIALIFLSGLT